MSQNPTRGALFRKIDCVQLPVTDLEAAIAFYGGQLGHQLLWRRETSAGLELPETEAGLHPRSLARDGSGERHVSWRVGVGAVHDLHLAAPA